MGRKRAHPTWDLVAAVAILSILTSLTPTGLVRAADDPAAAEAKKHYEEGTKAFNLGEYPRAITEFKATYNAKPDPLLLYNIAQSYRLEGDLGQALFFYKSFLRNMPTAPNRKEVDGRIKTLEKQIADQKVDQKKEPGTIVPIIIPSAPVGAVPPPTTTTPPAATAPSSAGTPPPMPASPSSAPSSPSPGESGPAGETKTSMSRATPPANPTTVLSTTASGPAAEVDLTTPTGRTEEPSRPIYKKWWFWVGSVAAVLVIGGVIAASANKPPNTPLGTYQPTFK